MSVALFRAYRNILEEERLDALNEKA